MKRNNNSPPVPEREELERQLETLQRDIRQLQLEHDLLKKANEVLKKDLGVDLQLLNNREKTLLVDALKDLYRLPARLDQLGLARSSYFYHRAQPSLLRLPQAKGVAGQAVRYDLREGCAAIDETGELGRCQAKAAAVRFLSWRNQSGTREPYQS